MERPASKTYVDRFFEALDLLTRIEGGPAADLAGIRRASEELQMDPGLREIYAKGKSQLVAFATFYLSALGRPAAHSCHAISHGFLKTWEQTPLGKTFPLAITVGNVRFQGQDIYGANLQTVLTLIREGPQAGRELPVHVWLTLDDMTVFDLSIKQSLRAMGVAELTGNEPIVWNDGQDSDFNFEPLLVDNNFFENVDTGHTVLLPGRS